MRIAAVALVLVVGAAVVLAFANTLNSWVLGGLLGGLAAILLSIPISLALFSLLARRHDARRRALAESSFAEEPDFAYEGYEDEQVAYESEGYLSSDEEDFAPDLRARARLDRPRPPVSGYLNLPPIDQDLDGYNEYEDDEEEPLTRREPRNYPRQPRRPARPLARNNENHTPPGRAYRNPSTRSLAEHQSAARRQARQEAQRQRSASDTRSRRSQERYTPPALHPRSTDQIRSQRPVTGSRRPTDDFASRRGGRANQQNQQSAWQDEEDFSDDFSTEQPRTRYQQPPRRRGYRPNPRASRSARPLDPWTGELPEDDEQEEPRARRPRRDPDRFSGSMRNPLVRRAPYLYEDDPLRAEFARQLDNEPPIMRRSSLYEDENEEEY